MNTNITIERCHCGDAYWEEIRTIRDLVFIEEQKVSPEEEYDEFEESSRHFLAFIQGKPAGTARWRRTENGIKLERFAVLKECRGMGVGKALVGAVISDVKSQIEKAETMYLHAQVHAIPFYEGCGFLVFGEEFSEAGISHRKMKFNQLNSSI
jgi:predicted GNAT family N-acyltransferase